MKKLLAALMALTVAGSAFATEIYVNTGHTSRGDYVYRHDGPRPHHPEHRRYKGPRRHHPHGNAYGHYKHHHNPHHRGPGPRR